MTKVTRLITTRRGVYEFMSPEAKRVVSKGRLIDEDTESQPADGATPPGLPEGGVAPQEESE